MSDQERIVHIKNEQATEEFGLNLASELKPGDIVALIGALGTGKTALTKYIAKGLGVTENIDSPRAVDCRSSILMSTDCPVGMICWISALMNISIQTACASSNGLTWSPMSFLTRQR